MAIVQISQITNRLGLQADLPQLAGAEFGWSTDTRQLYIGNGTLEEGAPVIGNTEILTEFSDILNIASSYTYKGTAAGYVVQTGPTPGTPVVQSLQNWMDQWASVKDFGATGDGVTDDTAAINRALQQLYCRNNNVQVRRSLFFPAGVYKVTSTINIPTYATLYGEGIDNTIIQLVDPPTPPNPPVYYVAQTADSYQQTGANIGVGGATAPKFITISNMAFSSTTLTKNIFLVQSASNCEFKSVGFYGSETLASLPTSSNATSGVSFGSTLSLVTSNILFDGCRMSGTVYGINTTATTAGVTVTNSSFNTLYQGIVLGAPGTSAGPTGTRITNNVFDLIYYEGVVLNSSLNATGYNIFYNVASQFVSGGNPFSSMIAIQNNNNVSIGDMFNRAYIDNYPPQVSVGGYSAITTTNGTKLQLGTKNVATGSSAAIADNVLVPEVLFTIDATLGNTFKVDYSITLLPNSDSINTKLFRTGTIWICAESGDIDPIIPLSYMEDYTQNADTNIVLSVVQDGQVIQVKYTSAPTTGHNGTISYSISYFN